MSPGERPGPALSAATDAEAAAAADAAAAAAEVRAEQARARADLLRRQAGLSAPTDAGRRRRLPNRSTLGVGVLVAVICASCATAGSLAWQHHVATRNQQRTAEAAAAAREGIEVLMSLESDQAQANVQRIIDHSTGKLRADYQQMSAEMVSDLQESKVATTVTVSDVAVQSVTGDRADVLVAVRTVRTGSDGAPQSPWPWRVLVTLTRDGGQLKMSKVEFI